VHLLAGGRTESLNSDGDEATWSRRRLVSGLDAASEFPAPSTETVVLQLLSGMRDVGMVGTLAQIGGGEGSTWAELRVVSAAWGFKASADSGAVRIGGS
jgi:hypothetical protein